MLVYHQAIHLKILNNHIMCPMQSRVSGVIINKFQKLLAYNKNEEAHDIVLDDTLYPIKPMVIHHMLKVVKSYLPVRKINGREYED